MFVELKGPVDFLQELQILIFACNVILQHPLALTAVSGSTLYSFHHICRQQKYWIYWMETHIIFRLLLHSTAIAKME